MEAPASESQAWLERRLEGLQVEDLLGGVRVLCTGGLRPPPLFQGIWQDVSLVTDLRSGASLLTEAEAVQLQAIVVICNQTKEEEVRRLTDIVANLDSSGIDCPPIFWMPHSVAPQSGHGRRAPFLERSRVTELLREGLDGVLHGEPAGVRLALSLRARFESTQKMSGQLQDLMQQGLNQRFREVNEGRYFQHLSSTALWDYVRERLAPRVPPMTRGLPPGELRGLPGFNVGARLGRGPLASVFLLSEAPDRGRPPQVAKVVSKESIRGVEDMKYLNRVVDVSAFLSTTEARHPGLVVHYETYHTPTHIVLRMEHGGRQTLYRRLRDREVRQADSQRPLALDRVASIIRQLVDVVAHLHTVAHVAHRDIKPENILVRETGDSIETKLIDYDLSVRLHEGVRCVTRCGTLPFVAPEVMLNDKYDGTAADMWSLGVVLLEVFCGVRVVEQSVWPTSREAGAAAPAAGASPQMAERIRTYFQEPGAARGLLQARALEGLQPLLPVGGTLLAGALEANPEKRMRAREALAVVSEGFRAAS